MYFNKRSSYSYLTLCLAYIMPYATYGQGPGSKINAELSTLYDNNILRQQNKTADNIFTLSPEVKLRGYDNQHTYLLNYQGSFTKFNEESQLDYNEHAMTIGAKLEHASRLSTQINISYEDTIDKPGSTNASTETLEEYIQYTQTTAEVKFAYGKKYNKGQLTLSLSHAEKEFDDSAKQYRDRDKNTVNTQFFYRLAPKTRVFIELSVQKLHYLNRTKPSDPTSTNYNYLLGLEWDLTAKTSGTIKLGYQKKAYDTNELYNDISDLSYSINLNWQASRDAILTFAASRETTESAQLGTGGFINDDIALKYAHSLSAHTTISTDFYFSQYDNTFTLNRTDTKKQYGLSLSHQLKRWLLSLKLKKYQRDSASNNFAYDANTISLSLKTLLH